MVYGGNQQFDVQAHGSHFGLGSWNLRNTRFQRAGPCSGFAVVYCVQKEDRFQLRVFLDNIRKISRERGMDLADAICAGEIEAVEAVRTRTLEAFLTERVQELEQRRGLKLGLLFAVMDDKSGVNGAYMHPALKR